MKALPLLFLAAATPLLAAPTIVPPSNHKLAQALGETEGIPPEIRTLFLDTSDILPIPQPQAIDWLASQRESGQTFAQFQAGRYNVPDSEHPYLYLQPLAADSFAADDLELLRYYCSAFFNTKVKVLQAKPFDPQKIRSRTNSFTGELQLHGADILKDLDLNKPDDAYAVIAFTTVDLYPDDSWNFVFGLANLRESVGVFSFARYGDREKDGNRYLERALKVMTHEIGHMYGMKHCTYYHCLMNGSNNLGETDRAPLHLCPVCLRKLHEATQPDHLMRYTKLKKTYQKLDLPEATQFAQGRVERILRQILE
ncbi:archaemetzincin [Pelagicoccus sp. SDUM812005]|uniref:archaemetzincin n=1 Tax=Pelagicoccus sp. SDUM812005 TaxID=3041257 RepID=UPI00280D2299|nr:archaemetzincin [Pelagicoccus sp. SDUM812005]MDQ8180166.1 archaemetzincin [Pelagicoccus sp. SDUM812005]